ncbi:glycosyltransferase involved in cell wall biosynthesis [Planomicrobium soli]|uniref:Glycosyltransferase involved in cell wall biosynthesis n=1 Tax=Planomicrobium soli TaxID=1176648 RepID=A0A2P8H1V9_9BACL|nr:glycosyltransferase [Planomicrobium soli]PSL40199.1 glycosyltransferase involved in cell wall biosynthesis [Planomicrobium soli]
MKIVLVSPNYPQPRGNTVTVERIAANLRKLGVQTEIISSTDEPFPSRLPDADLVHGFHAHRFHKFVEQLAEPPFRYVVTITGTDLNVDLFEPDKREDVLACLKRAAAIHVFDRKAKAVLVQEAPELQDKIFPIAQGNSEFSTADSFAEKEPGTFLFVLPAGIRKIKNVPAAITMLEKLHVGYPDLRLWLAGPVLEEAEGELVDSLIEQHKDWVRYLGAVPHPLMGPLYRQADAVLNTSLSEGQPAAILEAMGYGCPVLVSDIPGNSSIVSNEENGFLYNDETEFLAYAESLMNNYEVREKMGLKAKEHIAENHSSTKEAEALLAIYRSILY